MKHLLLMLGLGLYLVGRAFALPIGDVRALYDWSDLPLIGAGRQVEASNFRTISGGVLKDATPGQAVLLDEKGPGCVTRITIYTPNGTLKVYLDGAAAPQIDIPLSKLYQAFPYFSVLERRAALDKELDQQFPFLYPLCTMGSGYKNACYVPIPFARGIKVVYEHPAAYPWIAYSILLKRYPEGTPVQSYDLAALQARESDVRAAALAWRDPGQPPMVYPDARQQTGTLAIPAKGTVELWKSAGSGAIVGLRLRTMPWNMAIDRLLVLRAYWDGEARPSVETPLGDLCASHGGVRSYFVLPAGGGGYNNPWYWCYLPMPFAGGARLTLENLGGQSITNLDYEITVRPGLPPANAGRFCARWKRDRQLAAGGHYQLLETTGAGKLVGYNLFAAGFNTPLKSLAQVGLLSLTRDGEAAPAFVG
ncbi:MAG TPA: DUF2961 domain-containing protein, partial [Armatimonadota bacterium]